MKTKNPCVVCGEEANSRWGWSVVVSVDPPITFFEAMSGVVRRMIKLRTCPDCVDVAREFRDRPVIGMYTPRRSGAAVMHQILDDAMTAARAEDERWLRESDDGTKFPVRHTDKVIGLGDFVPGGSG